jgi:hypothetical protein
MSAHLPGVVHAVMSHPASAAAPLLDGVMLFGFVAGLFTLLCYKEQNCSKVAVLGLAIGSAAMAAFAFLKGVWPLGIVEIAAAIASLQKWRQQNRKAVMKYHNPWQIESRINRLFGSMPIDQEFRSERQ